MAETDWFKKLEFKSYKEEEKPIKAAGKDVKVVKSLSVKPMWLGPWHGGHRAIWTFIDPSLGTNHVSVSWELVPPGQSLSLHSHKIEEIYVIMQGKGVFYTPGEEHYVEQFDAIFIPPGVVHSMRNIGMEDLWFLYVWAGPEVPKSIEEYRSFQKGGLEVGKYP